MISSSELRKLAKESGERVYWDEGVCEEAKVEDIDEEKIRWFLRRARYERRLEISPDISVREALERLNLIKNNKLTSAAILLFGKEPQKVWEYPINALREAIVNAICHRDYVYSSDITIGVFDDRIEITNPRMLPEPLTPEDLKKTHKSILRNPLVTNAFFLIKNIEQWGEGTNKIKKGAYYVAREHVPKK